MLAGSILATTPAAAQVMNQDLKLTAADADFLDEYGHSVAVSGTTAVVGSHRDDDAGQTSGSVYVYDITTGLELFKLIASDTSQGDQFGHAVATSGSTAIIGAFRNGDDGEGAAYLFDIVSGQQLHKLNASDDVAFTDFGYSVAISGNIAIVGAPRDDDGGANAGAAYLFDTSTGQQISKLSASDAEGDDWFGWSVAISGTTAIIGALREDSEGSNSGAAYVFDTTTSQQLFKLTASDAAAFDTFGVAVAISGNTAIVGASGDSYGLLTQAGSAYIFDATTGQELFKLTASDAAGEEGLGNSIDISGDIAILGASHDGDGGWISGSVYVFDVTSGQEVGKLTAADTSEGDLFGNAVAISGSTAVVGAFGDAHKGADGQYTGSAYVFNLNPCLPDWNTDDSLNFFDISEYIADYNAQSPAADLAAPFGSFNFFDIAEYISLFNAGCP